MSVAALAEHLIATVRGKVRTEVLQHYRALAPHMIDTKSGAHDLVTVADRNSEAIIAEAVRAFSPDDISLVGEEAVAAAPGLVDAIGAADLSVIVDPIDGTWNFAKGLPLFGVIVAIATRGVTQFGLLYDPMNDDYVVGFSGGGAWYQNPARQIRRPLQVSHPGQGEALTGFAPTYLFPASERVQLAAKLSELGRVTSYGCSCHEYRLLIDGQADFILADQAKPWDHAAGVLIHAEAGGHAAFIDGRPYTPTESDNLLLVAPSAGHWATLAGQLTPCFASRGSRGSAQGDRIL